MTDVPEEISMSREHEMKRAHDYQQQFHSRLKECTCKLRHLSEKKKAREEEYRIHLPDSLQAIVRTRFVLVILVTTLLK